jgi:hypothetical protein
VAATFWSFDLGVAGLRVSRSPFICYNAVKIVGGKRLAIVVKNSYILLFVSVG